MASVKYGKIKTFTVDYFEHFKRGSSCDVYEVVPNPDKDGEVLYKDLSGDIHEELENSFEYFEIQKEDKNSGIRVYLLYADEDYSLCDILLTRLSKKENADGKYVKKIESQLTSHIFGRGTWVDIGYDGKGYAKPAAEVYLPFIKALDAEEFEYSKPIVIFTTDSEASILNWELLTL